MTCGVSVDEFVGAGDDEPIECDSDTIEREAVKDDSDGDSVDSVTIRPSEAQNSAFVYHPFFRDSTTMTY